MQKKVKSNIKDVSMPTGNRKISPNGASVLINYPTKTSTDKKKKVGLYGLI